MECKSQSLVPYQLGDTPLLLAHLGGFEPPAHGLEVRCSIQLSYRCLIGAGEGNRTLATSLEGWGSTTELHPQLNIELVSRYTMIKMVEESGFEPLKAELTDLQSVPFGQLGNSSEECFRTGAGGRT